MKNVFQKALSLVAALALLMGALCGCSASEKEAGEPSSSAQAEAGSSATVANLEPDADGNVTITDMAGRSVTFPANPRVWNSSPTAEGWLCAIIPDQIVGWASEFNEEQLSFWPEAVSDLPVLGGNYGNNEANVEGILDYAPDVIINTYDCSSAGLESTVSSADEMANQYGIPVVVISRDIADSAEIAGLVGLWFGQAERGAEVEAYLQTILDEIDETVSAVPEEEIPTYYYAEGTDGLSTESADSIHSDVFTYLGLKAAVGDDVQLTSMGGMEAVSLEQVLQWNPEYIFVWNPGAYQSIIKDEAWADITAIQESQVYLNPMLPENWVDRSPNSLRILGCLYYAGICYSDYCTYNYEDEIVKFFDFMYGVELSDDQLASLFVSMA